MPGTNDEQGNCQIAFEFNARPAAWSFDVPAAQDCTLDLDRSAGYHCDMPAAIECDHVFNCPDVMARRGRGLKFGYMELTDVSVGTCVPSA